MVRWSDEMDEILERINNPLSPRQARRARMEAALLNQVLKIIQQKWQDTEPPDLEVQLLGILQGHRYRLWWKNGSHTCRLCGKDDRWQPLFYYQTGRVEKFICTHRRAVGDKVEIQVSSVIPRREIIYRIEDVGGPS